MNVLCLQSMLVSVMPCDLGVVGTPAFVWTRDAFMWVRRVSLAGGGRAVVAWALLVITRPLRSSRGAQGRLIGSSPQHVEAQSPPSASTVTSFVAFTAGLVVASLGYAPSLHAEPNRVKFPELEKLVHYTTVKRGNVTEHIMTTPQAIAAIKQGQPAPAGTHFVLVDYREGKVHRYFVMQKDAGWGADYDAKRRTGDWQFQWFWADRSLNLSENTARCQSCHEGQKDSDYLYTARRIAEFDKAPVE